MSRTCCNGLFGGPYDRLCEDPRDLNFGETLPLTSARERDFSRAHTVNNSPSATLKGGARVEEQGMVFVVSMDVSSLYKKDIEKTVHALSAA